MINTATKTIAVALFALGLIGSSISAARADDLADIKKRGTVRIGILTENPPWSSMNTSGQLTGYDVDVADALAKKIGVKPEYSLVTTPNRIAQLLSGKVDLLIAVVGMYPDRAKVVQFSKPYASLDIIALGKKSDNISKPEDLMPFKIGTPKGSAQDTAISKALPDGKIQRFDDDASTIQALLSGQVDVIGANSTYILKIRQAAPNSSYETKVRFSRQYNGVAMRPNEKELNVFVNAFLDEMVKSGQLAAIYKKWIGDDMPEFPTSLEGIPFTVQ
jgi:polar amino acid transport system substrate-binding protein